MIYKYSEFLTEDYDNYDDEPEIGDGSKHLTRIDFDYYLKKYCSDFKWEDKPIYKSSDAFEEDEFGYFDAHNPTNFYIHNNKKLRKSAYTIKNYYTLIMNHLPSWSDYPKRQVICSTKERRIRNFPIYRVIPFNGSKWGVVPSDDIQTNGVKLSHDFIYEIREWLKLYDMDCFHDLNRLPFSGTVDDFKSLKNAIEDLGIDFNEFDYLLTPSKMNFVVKTYKQLIKYNSPFADYEFTSEKQNEIWTDSDVLMYAV